MYKILCVEDNENNRLVVEDLFRKHRKEFSLQFEEDPRELMERVKADPPDVLLLDMGLPHISGWELAGMLKEDPQTAVIPIIAVTAHAMKGDREKALEAGCDDYVTKPLKRPVLMDIVKALLSKSTEN